MKSQWLFLMLMILTAVFPAAAMAQDANTVLNSVTKAMGVENLKSLHYAGSGSSYIVEPGAPPAGGWQHSIMKSYVRDLNLDTATSKLQWVRVEGNPPMERSLNHSIDPTAPWASQYEFWLTPYGFLKGARANHATVESKVVFGTPYQLVSFTLPGNHKVVGYINDKNLIEKVETWIGERNDVLVEAFYREYESFGNLKFPTLISQNHAGSLSMILVVKEVKAG